MIYIEKFKGRFGNHLFQIASGIAMAKKHNDTLYIPDSWPHKKYFPENEILKYGDPGSFNIESRYKETRHGYNEVSYENNMNLTGYFQSYLYFDHIKRDLLDIHFNMNGDMIQSERQDAVLPNFDKDNEVAIIHVRLGDYKREIYKGKFIIQDEKYYDRAINYLLTINPNMNFFVISDDIEACKKEYEKVFSRKNLYFITANEKSTMMCDFHLMTEFHHVVMSSSTFSWWGAYLNRNPNKKVIMPENWFGPEIKNDRDVSGIYLPEYIIL